MLKTVFLIILNLMRCAGFKFSSIELLIRLASKSLVKKGLCRLRVINFNKLSIFIVYAIRYRQLQISPALRARPQPRNFRPDRG